MKGDRPMRLKDFLTEEEDTKLEQLKSELLDAPNDKVRTLILAQIDEILDAARSRYNALFTSSEEQATTYEHAI